MKLKRTDLINQFLNESPDGPNKTESLIFGDNWIDHISAVRLGKSRGISLFRLLKGTEVYTTPPAPPPPKSPEYLQFIAQLRRDEEERQYKALVGDEFSGGPMNLQAVSKEVNDQLTTIFNILISIVAVGWAFWYWCSSWSLGARTLMSLFAGMAAGVAEVVVYTGYLRRAQAAKLRQPALKETRQVTREFVFHKGKELTAADVSNEDANEIKVVRSEFKNEEKKTEVKRRG